MTFNKCANVNWLIDIKDFANTHIYTYRYNILTPNTLSQKTTKNVTLHPEMHILNDLLYIVTSTLKVLYICLLLGV